MLVVKILQTISLLVLATSTKDCIHELASNASIIQVFPTIKNAMSSTTNISIKSLTLLAREERRPPVGVSPAANRDIGFASVFIRLENTKEEDAYLIIKSIQIQNVADGSIQMASKSPQPIHLSPLENSENAFHLANKTGYSGQDKVKAVILYQLGDRVQVIESIPVEVKRH